MSTLREEGIGSKHFYDLRHAAIFSRIKAMLGKGDKVDLITLQAEFKKDGFLDGIGGITYLSELMDCIPSVANLPYYVPLLKEAFNRRGVLRAGYVLAQCAQDNQSDSEALLEDAENAVRGLKRMAIKQPLSLRSIDEILKLQLDAHDNILGDRLLAKGQSLTILGPGGIGKSRLLLQLAASCILGRPFVGLRTHNSSLKWLVIQAENSNRRLQADLQALQRWAGGDLAQLNAQLRIHTLEHNTDHWLNLDSLPVRSRIAEMIAKSDADVVCFDPLNCFAPGDLNNDRDMRTACQWLTRLCLDENPARAIVVLHHSLTGKMGVARATGFERSGFGRNSKLLHAWTRGQINLAPASPDDNARLVISCGKCSNGEEFKPYALRLNPETMIYEEDHEFDLESWSDQFEANKSRKQHLREMFEEFCAKPVARQELARRLQSERGYSRSCAYDSIARATKWGWLNQEPGSELLRMVAQTQEENNHEVG